MNKKISRRIFIKALGLGVGGAAFCQSPAVLSALAAKSEPVDVMIIGSGFGGAVTALRLAERGIHSVMLERGKRWPVTREQNTFSTLSNPDGRSAWLSDFALLGEPKRIEKYIGVLELVLGNGIAALAGAGVGGGSLVYAGALYQPSQTLFKKAFADSVDYHEMDSIYYPRVRSVIKPQPIPKKILSRPEYAAAKMWQKLGQRAGLRTKLIDLGISWEAVLQELQGKRVPSVITGEFWYGNNSGAKHSLDKNYLRDAEKTGYLDIQTQQNVTSIKEGPDGRYVVASNELDDNGNVLSERKFVVKKLFLAAGSMATSKLLVRAKARHDLPALNNEVGQHWGNNGDFFSQITNLPSPIKPNLGGPAVVAIEDHYNPIAPTTVECYADWSLEGQQGIISSVGMSTPPAKGQFVYDAASDQVVLTWPGNDPDIAKIMNAGANTYELIANAWGLSKQHVRRVLAGYGALPEWVKSLITAHPLNDIAFPDLCNLPGRNLPEQVNALIKKQSLSDRVPTGHCATPGSVSASVTAHPLGGSVLDRATDNIGGLKNYHGLYVMDGALVPGHTGCTNPALTIAALAERNIERIVKRDFS